MDVLMAVVWSENSRDESGGREPDASVKTDPGELLRSVAVAVDEPLAALGVEDYLVNVRDEQVAGALIDVQVTPRPVLAAVRARVPVASATACSGVIDALSGLGPVSAWSVTASEPLPVAAPADAQSGTCRCEGMANLAFLRRPDRIDRETWLRTWLEEHTQVAIDTQSTTGYTQHVVVRALTDDAPVIDGIVEEIFPLDAARDLGVFFDSRGSDDQMAANVTAMTASTARFLDEGTVDAIPTGRYVMRVPGPTV
ncbi:EthD domain-containing protein [Dietzia sp. NCCP-2495]|uniref:EthD domain-containing protein n=1 Tax=Dietzia sp. NCCP-2495 TaxID=2934675 RepID=UPI002231D49F|nr:EthD domain-containing protein [Dietzia sp. NCCP-2495]